MKKCLALITLIFIVISGILEKQLGLAEEIRYVLKKIKIRCILMINTSEFSKIKYIEETIIDFAKDLKNSIQNN